MLRQQSSALLRQKFPQAVEESAPADFWAPGYLVVSGRQPPTPAMIHDYIQQTRRRQGAP
jgi:REP element-mobilizing transposase RayT